MAPDHGGYPRGVPRLLRPRNGASGHSHDSPSYYYHVIQFRSYSGFLNKSRHRDEAQLVAIINKEDFYFSSHV